MPIDKTKHLALFPDYFKFPIHKGTGKWFMILQESEKEAKSWARKYRCFINSIKAAGCMNYLLLRLNIYSVRTKLEKQPGGEVWCYVVVKSKIQFQTDQGEII